MKFILEIIMERRGTLGHLGGGAGSTKRGRLSAAGAVRRRFARMKTAPIYSLVLLSELEGNEL
jgi:hypothetical protein